MLIEQGRDEEAERFVETSLTAASPSDVSARILAESARGRLLARSGETTAAEAAARNAVELARGTENLNLHGRALLDLGEVLRLAGRPNEAIAAIERAVQAFEQKGNIAAVARARTAVDAPRPATRL